MDDTSLEGHEQVPLTLSHVGMGECQSKGDYISFLDTDDLWDKEKLELQIPYFNNPDVGVVFSNLWILNKDIKKKKLYTNKKLPRGNI